MEQMKFCGTNIKKIRNEAKITQKELADITGIPLKTIRNIEQERYKKIPIKNMILIAHALECSIQDFLPKESNLILKLKSNYYPKDLKSKNTEEYLYIEEVASLFNLSRSAIYHMINDKRLPAEKNGKRWLIKKTDVTILFEYYEE